MYVCMYVCMNACMYACIYVCMYVYANTPSPPPPPPPYSYYTAFLSALISIAVGDVDNSRILSATTTMIVSFRFIPTTTPMLPTKICNAKRRPWRGVPRGSGRVNLRAGQKRRRRRSWSSHRLAICECAFCECFPITAPPILSASLRFMFQNKEIELFYYFVYDLHHVKK